jgi:hypothetical protein
MTFVAAPPANPPAAVADAIAGDGWYPDLSIAKFKGAMRIGAVVADLRAREALLGGFVSAATALVRWRAAQQSEGKHGLAETTDMTIGGESRSVILWRRAVHAFAAADLAETHGDISATEAGRERIEVRAQASEDLRRDATVALRDLMGRGRTKIGLI